MSLLAELIAQLTALTEQSSQARTGLGTTQDQIMAVLDQVRTTTSGSDSSLVTEGLGQLEAALEKIAEASARIGAGDQAIASYITGPLLGGAASGVSRGGADASPGTSSPASRSSPTPTTRSTPGTTGSSAPGSTPPGAPAQPREATPHTDPSATATPGENPTSNDTPPTAPASTRTSGREAPTAGSRSAGPRTRTQPSHPPDPDRRPGGRPTPVDPGSSSQNQGDIRSENHSATVLARAGYDIEQNPPPRANGKAPDYFMEGDYWDCYTVSTDNPERVRKSIGKKVNPKDGRVQAERIVLNLDTDTSLPPEVIEALLQRKPVNGLREVKVVNDGHVRDLDLEG